MQQQSWQSTSQPGQEIDSIILEVTHANSYSHIIKKVSISMSGGVLHTKTWS